MPTLSIDVHVGESILIDGKRITLTVEEKSGRRVKLALSSSDGVQVERPAKSNAATLAATRGVTKPPPVRP